MGKKLIPFFVEEVWGEAVCVWPGEEPVSQTGPSWAAEELMSKPDKSWPGAASGRAVLAAETIPDGVRLIGAPEVWEPAGFGEGVVIAVIDTGIDKFHPDLRSQIIGGKDFTGTGDYQDDNGHGTHVSGTIGAALNGGGVVGVAPGAKILALKALNAAGEGNTEWICEALEYAIGWAGPGGERVSVISMSLGGPEDEEEHQLIKEACACGILVVCAAGNDGDGASDTDEWSYPGAYPEVVEVGAVGMDRQPVDFSNSNSEVDLVAPGVGILSTYPGGRYAKMSGTSMAAPHVSGAAALVKILAEKEFGRPISEAELYAQVCRRTLDLGASRKLQGNGLVQLGSAGKELTLTVESAALGLPSKKVRVFYP